VVEALAGCGHSRIPVYTRCRGNMRGFISIKVRG
jgi:CBS domain containing-hemolysin-like protein